jgi:hypothetical protein
MDCKEDAHVEVTFSFKILIQKYKEFVEKSWQFIDLEKGFDKAKSTKLLEMQAANETSDQTIAGICDMYNHNNISAKNRIWFVLIRDPSRQEWDKAEWPFPLFI